jgi:hypothetical protein
MKDRLDVIVILTHTVAMDEDSIQFEMFVLGFKMALKPTTDYSHLNFRMKVEFDVPQTNPQLPKLTPTLISHFQPVTLLWRLSDIIISVYRAGSAGGVLPQHTTHNWSPFNLTHFLGT